MRANVLLAVALLVACNEEPCGAEQDAATRRDAGVSNDGGEPEDAGTPPDASSATDAGAFDPARLGVADDAVHCVPADGPYGYATFRPDQPGFPAPGESFIDPVFGTTITRVTDHHPDESFGNVPYARNGFSNADGSRVFSARGIYDVTRGEVAVPSAPAAGGLTQSFHPLQPSIYLYPEGSRLMRHDLEADTSDVVRDFGVELQELGGSVDWIDRTGRYALLNLAGQGRLYDTRDDRLFDGAVDLSAVDAGWAGLSPDARWVVTAGSFLHRAFAVDLSAGTVSPSGHVFWTLCGDHGDLATASDGTTFMITQECYDQPDVYAVDVSIPQTGDDAAGRQKQRDDNRLLFRIDWHMGAHYSAPSVGPMQDWAFVSTEVSGSMANDPSGDCEPYRNEIVMVNLLDGRVRRLAHHRSDINGYCAQPRVQAAWDGSGVFWVSNFGDDRGSCGYSDLYYLPLRP